MTSSENVEDLRSVKRFVIDPPLHGAFGNVDITIADFGERGVQAEHAAPIKLAAVSRLSFTIPRTQEVVRLEARVMWSRLSKKPDASGKYLYRSGLRVVSDADVMKSTLSRMVYLCLAQPDTASMERKRMALVERARVRSLTPTMKPVLHREPEIPEDHILLIQQARARLQAMPEEAVKWYNRARYSQISSDLVQHNREEVMAVWEYLERTLDIAIIARVFDQHK